jgi:hypothetical protein
MSAAEWVCFAWFVVNITLLGLLAWGDWRGERYYDELDARVAKIIDSSLKGGMK